MITRGIRLQGEGGARFDATRAQLRKLRVCRSHGRDQPCIGERFIFKVQIERTQSE